MAAEDQGIMSLPMGGQEPPQPMPALPLEDSYDAVNQGLQNAAPQAAADIQQLMASITPQLDQLSDEDLASFIQAIQYLYEGGEQEYAKRLQEVIASGLLDPGDLPDDYDPEVLSAIGTVLLQAQRERAGQMAQMAEPPPQQFARGGIAEAARMVAAKGRNGDTMLAHITPDEARLLKARGGSGTINPKTGLPEFFLKAIGKAIKGVFKGIVNAVKGILKSPIGRILATVALATFLGPGAFGVQGLGMTTMALPVAAGTVTLASGGSLKDALVAGATAYFGAPGGAVSQYVGAAGITNVAANAAITAGIVGTGAGLLSGQKLSDAVKTGLTAGAVSGLATGVQKGFMSDIPGTAPRPLAPVDDRSFTIGPDGAVRPVAPSAALAPVPPPASVAAPAMRLNTESGDMYTPLSTAAAPAAASAAAPATGIAAVRQGLQLPPGAVPSPAEIAAGYTAEGGAAGASSFFKEPFAAAKNFYQQNISPSGIQAAAGPAAQEAGTRAVSELMARMPDATPAMKEAAFQSAYKAAMPGIVGTYGPAVATGLGIMGLAGGFSPNQPQPSALANQMRGTPGLDLLNRNPNQYLVQGLPGVQYTPQGAIAGTSAWSPTATMADVQAPTPSYTGGGIFGMPMNYSNPYFAAADGGLASLASGGYPRKTGAISGPGTEKSDSIPAMLSDGEFVMTAKAVRGLGKGSRREGAKKMYALMHQLERNASRG